MFLFAREGEHFLENAMPRRRLQKVQIRWSHNTYCASRPSDKLERLATFGENNEGCFDGETGGVPRVIHLLGYNRTG